MPQPLSRPTYVLVAFWLLCLLTIAGSAWFAVRQPALGVALAVDKGEVRVAKVTAPQAVDVPVGARVLRLNDLAITPEDLNNDPDTNLSYEQLNVYYARLDALAKEMRGKEVALVWADAQGVEHVTAIHPQPRLLRALPMEFWFILLVSSLCFMITAWVVVLKPQDWGARMFFLTGIALMISAIPTAIGYSGELAYMMSMLVTINHFGASMYGATMVGFFLCYPRRLVPLRYLLWVPVLPLIAFLMDVAQAGTVLIMIYCMSGAMLVSVILSVIQWRLSRHAPLERASLRWLLLSMMLGLALLMATLILPPLFGRPTLMSTGYAFGFFLIMYVGIALGLRRYRLFEMDEWAYRVLLWVAGATAVIALDTLLLYTGIAEEASLGLTLLLCGWLYFPFRQWLWRRMVGRRRPRYESVLPELSAVAFTADPAEQRARWQALLQRVFDPLNIQRSQCATGIQEDGLALHIAGAGILPGYALHHAGRGTRLFSTQDVQLASSLLRLLEQVHGGRVDYEKGVSQERQRLGRDLHDNIGARLLKLIHRLRDTPDAELAREAMKDLRTTIAAMDSRPVRLSSALADWRAEALSRCEAAGCALHWRQSDGVPEVELPSRKKAALESALREVVTNALKHAAPSRIRVDIATDAGHLRMTVVNDGVFNNPLSWQEGYGLRNLRGRLEEMGGHLRIAADDTEVRILMEAALA